MLSIFRKITYCKTALILLAVILIFSNACDNRQPQKKADTANIIDSLKVVRVIDGDTFVLGSGKSVRIAMIDTPEKDEPLYHEAAQYVESLILNHQVTLDPVGIGQDRYGRLLAEVYHDSINIGNEVLKAGLGIIYIYGDNAYLKDKYLPAQVEAIDKKVGLWSLPEPLPEDFYINIKGSYRFHRPLCPHLKKVRPEKIVRYDARLKALKQGLSPCRNCKP